MAVMISKSELLRWISNVPGEEINRWALLGLLDRVPQYDLDMTKVRRQMHCRDCKYFNGNQGYKESSWGRTGRFRYRDSCDAYGKDGNYTSRKDPTPSMPRCSCFEEKTKR